MSRKKFKGVVVSTKATDTCVVKVERSMAHPLYKKKVRLSKRYAVHNEGNTVNVGDKVCIIESRPRSKTKKFELLVNSSF